MYKIIPHKKVIKFIGNRALKDKNRIKKKFLELENNPYPNNKNTDTKKLQGRGGFRLRVGDYRFLYTIEENELIIYMEDADNRGDVY